MLESICHSTSSVCFSQYEALLFRAAFVLAFFGALRISELIPANKQKVSGLQIEHMLLDSIEVRICINRSKTDQLGRGQWIILSPSAKSFICPVFTLRLYVDRQPAIAGNFLIHVDGSPLTKFQFEAVFKKMSCLLEFSKI